MTIWVYFSLQTEMKKCESFTKVPNEKAAGDECSTHVTTAQEIILCCSYTALVALAAALTNSKEETRLQWKEMEEVRYAGRIQLCKLEYI